MDDAQPALESWPRPLLDAPGDQPFVFFAIFGEFNQTPKLSRSKYRCAGTPEGISVHVLNTQEHGERISGLREGHHWDSLLLARPRLAQLVAEQTSCIVVRGEPTQLHQLDYLRDVIGLVMWLLDNGCVAVCELMQFRWWSPPEWRDEVFGQNQVVPGAHVVILTSPEDNGTHWFHTRGMRLFGRPDISVSNVPTHHFEAATVLCRRMIDWQARGGVVTENQEIRLPGLPAGGRFHHRGSVDDLDFNNRYVEAVWPAGSDLGRPRGVAD